MPGDEVKLIPANIYASIKDRPVDSRCELLTVIRRRHRAGQRHSNTMASIQIARIIRLSSIRGR